MAIKTVGEGHGLTEITAIMVNNMDWLLNAVNAGTEVTDPDTLKPVGGVRLFELRRNLNTNFTQLASDLTVTGMNVSLGQGDSIHKVKRVFDSNFVKIVATVIPAAFTIPAKVDQVAEATITSATVTPTGFTGDSVISIVGGEFRINSGDYGSDAAVFSAGDTFNVQVEAGADPLDVVEATVTIGGVSAVFSVTTAAE